MEIRFDPLVIASATGVAAYVAVVLGYVAVHDLGLSSDLVRSAAMLAAILIAAALAIDYFGKKLDHTK
jgi:hypothetical protein